MTKFKNQPTIKNMQFALTNKSITTFSLFTMIGLILDNYGKMYNRL